MDALHFKSHANFIFCNDDDKIFVFTVHLIDNHVHPKQESLYTLIHM